MYQKEEKISKYIKIAIKTLSVYMSLLFLYSAYFGMAPAMVYRTNFLSTIIIISFLLYPLGGKFWYCKFNWRFLINIFTIICPIIIQLYIFNNIDEWYYRFGNPLTFDVIFGTIYFALTIEATRRVIGLPISLVAIFFMLTMVFSEHLFGVFFGPAMKWSSIIGILFMRTVGIFGTPIEICAAFVCLFLLFGSLMKEINMQKLMADLAYALTGRQVGGGAKAAVVASALMGTISGSSSANVAGTGSFTIPLMKRLGYEPIFAASVEACASNGGQIMPPVMGAAAFVIAQFLGVPYWSVVKAAFIPAILYFLSLFVTIHFESHRKGLLPIPEADLPNVRKTLKDNGLPSISIFILIIFLYKGYSLGLSVFWAFLIAFCLSFVSKSTRIKPQTLIRVFEEGFKTLIPVALACACAGIVVGSLLVSGLGFRICSVILVLGMDQMILTLLLAAIICLILGMGILTTAVYITAASLVIPALISVGVETMSANLFVFYFAVASCVTPPVATAAYIAASIAGTNMYKTGISAAKIGIAGYFIPFIFVYRPELLLIKGSFLQIISVIAVTIVAVICCSIGLVGYFYNKKLSGIERFLLFSQPLLAINMDIVRSMLILIFFVCFLYSKRKYFPKKFN